MSFLLEEKPSNSPFFENPSDHQRALILFEERASDSPFVERIWASRSEQAGSFISLAVTQWEMVITKYQGTINLTVRGPETYASKAYCPEEGEWIGIRFKLGTFMPFLPARTLLDNAVILPGAASQSFWLDGRAWQFPSYDNADTFVDQLVRSDLLVKEPIVASALHGQMPDLSLRSAQRRFLQATGLTQGTARQIKRARYATTLLQDGMSILDTVEEAGYFDQPHLTRSLRQFIGLTPTQIMRREDEQLSFLYKTAPLD